MTSSKWFDIYPKLLLLKIFNIIRILDLFASGWTEDQIIDNYPPITKESLKAVFGYVAECMREEALYFLYENVSNETVSK